MAATAKVQEVFRVGDKAVIPPHGVGVVERIENKEISGSIVSFYVLRILDRDVTVMVPLNNTANVGMRRIISPKQVPKVFKIFAKQDIVIDTTTWNRRQREYMEKLKTGSVFEIAEVMRDLYVLKKTKTLSFGERNMLDNAKNLLIKELALAKQVDENQIEKNILKHFET